MQKVIVVGAGLGGLTLAGLLAKRGFEVDVFERSTILGGRSHVISKDGFTMSYGAHAVLAPKAEPMKSIIQELDLKMEYRKMKLSKFKLFSGGKIVSSPLGTGLLTSPAVPGISNRIRSLQLFFKMMKTKPNYPETYSIKQWIEDHSTNKSVSKLLSAYASLSVYDGALEQYSMNRFAELTNLEYETNEALSYMGYDLLLNELQNAIINNGGRIHYRKEVSGLMTEAGTIKGVQCKDETYGADLVILNLPPTALKKLTVNQDTKEEISPYLDQSAHYTYVYDIKLSKQLPDNMTNLLDLDNRVYLNVYSLNNPSSAPDGAGLINVMRFLTAAEQEGDNNNEESRKVVEATLDSVYPDWKSNMVGKRIINRAKVSGIARRTGNQLLPLQSQSTNGLYFVGDSTEGRGSLGMPCYDSAYRVANIISNEK